MNLLKSLLLIAQYADLLGDVPAESTGFRSRTLGVSRLDYNWSINDSGH